MKLEDLSKSGYDVKLKHKKGKKHNYVSYSRKMNV